MKKINYCIEKNKNTNEIVYIEYDKIAGYKITPKTNKEDAITVNKIVFVNSSLTEKLIKKKIDIKLRYLLSKLNEIDEEDDDSEAGIRETLVTAERLKLSIINNYVKYLGGEYTNLSLKKLQISINELRFKLFNIKQKKYNELYYAEENMETKGRKGR